MPLLIEVISFNSLSEGDNVSSVDGGKNSFN